MRPFSAVVSFLLFVSSAFAVSPRLIATPFGLVDADVPYAALQRNSMDLYIPHPFDCSRILAGEDEQETAHPRPAAPVLLFIHGGSFVAGDRKEFPYAQIGEAFQREGFLCAVMSYRLLKDSVWPAQPRDVARAVRWLKENAAAYGGDPHRIYIVGHSAGGHLAALISTDSTYLNEEGLSFRDIAGTVSMGAMMSDAGSLASLTAREEEALFRTDWFFRIFGTKANFVNSLPIRHVNPAMPSLLLILADAERYDPPKERTILEFMTLARECGAPVQYRVLHDRTHMGTVEQMIAPEDPAIRLISSFINEEPLP